MVLLIIASAVAGNGCLLKTGTSTLTDVLPIVGIIVGFQLLVLRQTIPNLKSVLAGFAYVLIGLTLFLVGLEEALFPPGRSPLLDGFGLIAFASLYPMMSVMGYAQLGEWRLRRINNSQ